MIIDAIGFFVQLFPCIFMIFLPFPDESCRLRRSTLFACLGIGTAALSIVFAYVMTGSLGRHTALAANAFLFFTLFITITSYAYLVNETLIKKLLVFFVVLFYGALQYCFVNILKGILFGAAPLSDGRTVYTAEGVILYIATAIALIPPMIMFITRILREYICEVDTRNMRREFIVLIISTLAFMAIMACIDTTYYYVEFGLYMFLLVLFLVLLFYQVLIYRLIFRESLRQKRESEQLRTMEIRQLQYEKIAGDMENTRRMHHDMRHHFNALSDMLERGQTDEMKEYLSNMISTTAKRENKMYCANMVINGLLQYYIGIASDEGIVCSVQAECRDMEIEPSDMTVLLGNAMENAINACRKYDGDKWIDIQIGTVGNSLAIEISNCCNEIRLDRHFNTEDGFLPAEAFVSSRRGGGCGLGSIANTVRKYGGSARFRFNGEKDVFTAQIRLNMNMQTDLES